MNSASAIISRTNYLRLFKDVLKVSHEPCVHFTDAHNHQLLTVDPSAYLSFVENWLCRIASGEASIQRPSKQIFSDPATGGDFRCMPCVISARQYTNKTVKIVGTNTVGTRIPNQITVGRAFRLDPVENFISHSFDACLFSSARTAACAVIAAKRLYGVGARVGIVGSGRIGYYTALYAMDFLQASSVWLCDREAQRSTSCVAALADHYRTADMNCRLSWQHQPCDVLIVATTSQDPFVAPDQTPARVIISVGADIETQRELTDGWPGQADFWTETKDSFEVGDLRWWNSNGWIQTGDVGDLLELIKRDLFALPQHPSRQVFISTGSAVFDNLTIAFILDSIAPDSTRTHELHVYSPAQNE